MSEPKKRKPTLIPKEQEFINKKKQEYEDQLHKFEKQQQEFERTQQDNTNNNAWIGWVIFLIIALVIIAGYLLGYIN